VYEDALAKTIGQISIKAPTSSGFSTDISIIIATVALNTAVGGTPSMTVQRIVSVVLSSITSATAKTTPSRMLDVVTVASYESDAILTAAPTWADTVSVLA